MPRRDTRVRYRRWPPLEDSSMTRARRRRVFKSTVVPLFRVRNLAAGPIPPPGMLQKSFRMDAGTPFFIPEAAFLRFLPLVIDGYSAACIAMRRNRPQPLDSSQRPFMSTA
jgi:hypothetical protein